MFRDSYHKWLIASALIVVVTVLADAPRDAAGWFQLAQASRDAGQLAAAHDALANAERLGFPPVRVGLERARLNVLEGRPDDAVAELQSLADGGFAAVGFITGDPILNGLAGIDGYDAVISEMSVSAYPCEHDDAFRDFDFWVGDWEVHGPNGTFAGSNSITPAERGCMLIESWTSAGGGTGMSINYLDGVTGEWVQVWNAESGSQINIRGGMTDDGMLLVGTLHTVGDGKTLPFRGLWTPLEDGRVRQFFEQSTDDGATWTPWFEGFYSRKQ
jgi:hypothetical protein